MSPVVAILLVVTAALVALVLAGRRAAARTTARVARVCRVGDDGIIPGAHAIALDGPPARAALVLHGFGDTPQSVAPLCRALHDAGWTVRAPLLPGHGRTLAEFERDATPGRLRGAAAEALGELRRSGARTIVIVGQSMGGALAARLVADETGGDDAAAGNSAAGNSAAGNSAAGVAADGRAPDVRALVLLAPYLAMAPRVRRLARLGPLWRFACPWVDTRDDRSIRDPGARAVAIGYAAQNAFTLRALDEVARAGWQALARIPVPTLVVASRRDNRVPVATLERAVARIGPATPRLLWRDDAGHVLAVDHGHAEVAREVVRFLAEHAAGERREAPGRGVAPMGERPQSTTAPATPLLATDGGA